MKTIQQIIDASSKRMRSTFTTQELKEMIIEASKQAWEATSVQYKIRMHDEVDNFDYFIYENKYMGIDDYLKEIDK